MEGWDRFRGSSRAFTSVVKALSRSFRGSLVKPGIFSHMLSSMDPCNITMPTMDSIV